MYQHTHTYIHIYTNTHTNTHRYLMKRFLCDSLPGYRRLVAEHYFFDGAEVVSMPIYAWYMHDICMRVHDVCMVYARYMHGGA